MSEPKVPIAGVFAICVIIAVIFFLMGAKIATVAANPRPYNDTLLLDCEDGTVQKFPMPKCQVKQ